jgi:outer membrane protein assembly factor BamB
MRAPNPFVTVALLALLALVIVATQAAAEWPMDGADAAHTGEQRTPVIGPAIQWQYQVDGEVIAPPSTAYGKLFLGTSDGRLVALDEENPTDPLWEVKLGQTISASPLVDSQTVFMPSENVLYAVTISNRSTRWSFEAVGNLRGSPIILDNVIYIGSEDKHVYALDKYSGDLVWSLKLDDVIAASPSVSGLILVVGTESGMVYGINRNQGTEDWRTDLGHGVTTAACIKGGVAMVGTDEGRLHALDMDNGAEKWTYPPKGADELDPILTTPVSSSGLVYFGADGLYCLEVGTGAEVWTFETGDTVRGSPAIVESFLVFGSYDGVVRCIDKNTANVVWRYRTTTSFRSGVTIDYDKAFIGGRDGILYARSILNSQAPVVTGPRTLEAEAHDSVSFAVSASDPEGNMLSYSWNFGDGNTSHEQSPLHEFTEAGEYTVTVTVSDGTKSKKHTIKVTVHPFETDITGGDPEGPSMLIVGGAAAAGVVVVLIIIMFLLLRRRGKGTPDTAEDPESQETVEWEETP